MSGTPTKLVRRDDGLALNHTMVTLLTVLLVVFIITLLLVGSLLFLRQRKRARKVLELPMYDEKRLSTSTTSSNHRRSRARPSQSIHIYHDKQIRVEDSSRPSSPSSPLPEIRITFPEEVDSSGKRQSGRVVVVHVGDTGVGLAPCDKALADGHDEGFQSVDLENVGGLMEKETRSQPGWR